ncbi:MAG: hypothetical protein OHK0012_08330 [Synechococcales cyanobacterium]
MPISDSDHSLLEHLRPFFVMNPKFENHFRSSTSYDMKNLWRGYENILDQLTLPTIQGLQEKLGDARDMDKLYSTLSELRVVSVFAKLGFNVDLIRDKCPNFPRRSPDLQISNRDFKALIEVTKWHPDETCEILNKLLAPIVTEKNLVVDLELPSYHSSLTVGGRERKCREIYLSRISKEVISYINNIDQYSLPLCLNILNCRVEIKYDEQESGLILISTADFSRIPVEDYEQQLIKKLKDRSNKPISWSATQRQLPYFIAIEIEQEPGQNGIMVPTLYGKRNHITYMEPNERGLPRVIYPSIVEERLKTSWRELLLTLGYDSTRWVYINSTSFFLNDENASRVCGVIVLWNRSLEYYPNPFVDVTLLRSDYDQLLRIPISPQLFKYDCRND